MRSKTKNISSPTGDNSRISDVSTLRGLDPTLLGELEGISATVSIQPGQIVLAEGVVPEFIGCVRQGILRMQKTLQDGRQQIVGLVVEGDLFGEFIEDPMQFSIEAASEASIIRFERNAFASLISRSKDLERLFLHKTLDELDRARDWMVVLTEYKINVRLAGFLVVLCTRYFGFDHMLQKNPDRLELKIPITRTDISHLLGTRVESVSRAFSALAKKGIIEVRTPYIIEILDINRLFEEAGNEEPDSLNALKQLVQNQLGLGKPKKAS